MTKTASPKTTRRGRPSVARAEALGRLVIDTARTMFLADGFDAVAMEQVAATAKISKGTLYARHPSKEALFVAVVEDTIGKWSDEASRDDYLLTDEIEQRLRHHAHIICRSLERPDVRAFQRMVLAVRDRFPGIATSMYDKGYKYIVDVIRQDLIAASDRDGRPARDPAGVAEMLVASITGRHIQEVEADGAAERVNAFGQRVVDLVLASRADW